MPIVHYICNLNRFMVERIRTLLESRQLTPTQFADLIGVARPIISHVLSGRNKPSLEVVQRILAAMPDLSMAWLLNGTEPMLTTTRETIPTTPAPYPAEAVAVPLSVASPQSAAAERSRMSASAQPTNHYQYVGNHIDNDEKNVSGSVKASVTVPDAPAASAAGRRVLAADMAAVAWPRNPAAGRPPMPRRFPLKPSGVDRTPAGLTGAPPAHASAMPLAPEDSAALRAGVASLPVVPFVVPVATAAAANTAAELLVKEDSVMVETASVEPLTAAGVAPLAPAVPEVVAPVLAPSGVEIPLVGLSAPTPGAISGAVPGAAPTLASDMASALFTGAEKPIRRIVIFYRDGSFADYQPE